MMKNIIIFLAGAAIGGAAAWFYQAHKYESILDEEIDSVKKAFQEEKITIINNIAEEAKNKPDLENILENNSVLVNYKDKIDKLDYSSFIKDNAEVKKDREVSKVPKPYTIDQSDFREFDDYEHITMDYYTDKILVDADDPDKPIDDISKYVGDCLKSVNNDQLEDWVYVRNESMKADIEIFINSKPFSEREV